MLDGVDTWRECIVVAGSNERSLIALSLKSLRAQALETLRVTGKNLPKVVVKN